MFVQKHTQFVLFIVLLLSITIIGCSSTAGSGHSNDDSDTENMNLEEFGNQENEENENQNDIDTEHRVVSTSVAVAEITDALEIDLIGVPKSYKDLPERYDDATVVGNAKTPDMELLKSMKPTEVLSVTSLEYDLAPYFEDQDMEIHFLNLQSLEGMKKEIDRFAEKYDRETQAEELLATFDTKISEIEKEVAGKESPTVLILLGVPGSYLVATENSYIGNLVEIAGGENIVEGESVEFLASNTEYLQQANPDVILRAAHGMPEEVIEMFDEEFKANDIWKHFNAVQNDRVYDLEELLFPTTGTIRVVESLDVLMNMLYPEN
ncbi:heme ABC transporter substrate-binding protein IsdE [Salipaludibacillus sp. HK11]|uniref:heme ABC transporter substrate-binding protein IsdE n=1 Tax=Salipaludibacillus sp. HK11 TaxID=3394320 RepID=UPI0039FD8107